MEIFVIIAGIAAGIALGLGITAAGLHLLTAFMGPRPPHNNPPA